FGARADAALLLAAGLAQIGEFSFILADLGIGLGALPERARHLILAGSILSILVNPLVFALPNWLLPRLRRHRAPAAAPLECLRGGADRRAGAGRQSADRNRGARPFRCGGRSPAAARR